MRNLDNKNRSLDGEVFELSNEQHVWKNRNGIPQKSIKGNDGNGALYGWVLIEDQKVIATAGASKWPTNATDWELREDKKLIAVQEYKGLWVLVVM